MRKQVRQQDSTRRNPTPSSAPPAVAPASSPAEEALIDPWATPMLDAVGQGGEDQAPPPELTDGLVPVSILVLRPAGDSQVDAHLEWAERAFSAQDLEVVVVSREDLPVEETHRLLGLDGDGSANEVMALDGIDEDGHEADHAEGDSTEERVDPGAEAQAVLARAWEICGESRASHVVFVPSIAGAQGVNLDSDSWDTQNPGVVIGAGEAASVMAHELGHHLGLEHLDRDDPDTANIMTPNSGNRTGFSDAQGEAMRGSDRVLPVPDGFARERAEPGLDRPPGYLENARAEMQRRLDAAGSQGTSGGENP